MRAEAQSLVAEAQLKNITRQKFKEAFDLHTAAIVERAEKQMILATHARRLLNLLDDTPTVPGEEKRAFENADQTRDVLNDAESLLRQWGPSVKSIRSSKGSLGANAMPTGTNETVEAPSGNVTNIAQQRVNEQREKDDSAYSEPSTATTA